MPLDPTHSQPSYEEADDPPCLRMIASLIIAASFLAGLALGRWLPW